MILDTPTYCFVLVRADEGSTQEIVVAHGRTLDALAAVVADLWTAAITACTGPRRTDNQEFLIKERAALVAMVARHRPCVPGRYGLAGIPPISEQCTLVITAQDGAWFPA